VHFISPSEVREGKDFAEFAKVKKKQL
jgi:hypothetical protein